MLEEEGRVSVESRANPRLIHCDECTIQIGDGYQESVPFEFVDDSAPTPKVMRVCWRCWESLNRRRNKRLGPGDEQSHGSAS